MSDPKPADAALADSDAYALLNRRLAAHGETLRAQAEALNARRVAAFGASTMQQLGRLRLRTEHNCVGRDLVDVGGLLLFGYNVYLGLKPETAVGDVFALYRLVEVDGGYDVQPVPLAGSFLDDAAFVRDFRELYAYYKQARLLQLWLRDDVLLASFQIGERLSDRRVFRWTLGADGSVRYRDNRGERDITPPPAYDFEWQKATREHAVHGRHPHLNILDTVFVETINGDLTVKIENNTDDGLGIYREPVVDATQSLDDAQIGYARVGGLILLRVLPYRETDWRYLIYDPLLRRVQRVDALGLAARQLPDDHGLIYPGGYYLQNGDSKTFDAPVAGMGFKHAQRAPNGEDVLYVFHEPNEGRDALFIYNLIERRLQPPLSGHGYALRDDGRVVLFSAEDNTPTRVHAMQIWQTPFVSADYAARQPDRAGALGRIGNAELVRGISELYGVCGEIAAPEVSSARYGRLAQRARQLFDHHHWLAEPAYAELAAPLREIATTAEAVLDEFDKVEQLRAAASEALNAAQARQRTLLASLTGLDDGGVEDYASALQQLATQRGHLLTLRERRYLDGAALDALLAELDSAQQTTAAATGRFLADARALQPYADRVQALNRDAARATTAAALAEPQAQMQAIAAELDTLSALITTLPIDDATQRTAIADAISERYAELNQSKARLEQQRSRYAETEAVAQFGAQFKLFTQSIAAALALARDPESCDEQLQRLLLQLEQLESQFGELPAFLAEIIAKREALLETFDRQRQQLLDARQRSAQALLDAGARIVGALARRVERIAEVDALNAFFAGDALILKLRELVARLRVLDASVAADDLEAQLKAARDQALRSVRDRGELFEDGGRLIKLGPRHRFSVNTQTPDLTLLPRGDGIALHLTGTDYHEALDTPELLALRAYWPVTLASESDALYRAEWLVGELLAAAEAGTDALTLDALRQQLAQPETLRQTVRTFAAQRYGEGYENGIHDHDAVLILQALLPLRDSAGLLRHAPEARSLALLAWDAMQAQPDAARWPQRARAARALAETFQAHAAGTALQADIATALRAFRDQSGLDFDDGSASAGAAFLAAALCDENPQFPFSRYGQQLRATLAQRLSASRHWDGLQQTLAQLQDRLDLRWPLALNACAALCADADHAALAPYAAEAAALLLLETRLPLRVLETELQLRVVGLLGSHPRLHDGAMTLAVDDYERRLRAHREQFLPGWQRYQQLRSQCLQQARETLRLSEFQARPLTSFVRNRLIDEVYLPLIGDNLAKQIGAVGEQRRSDLMGLLLLISPPGYGKTTLLEYVAHQLGLIFMKINGPALGHGVRGLDPAQAPDAAARREMEKLNLALEMGNNVMLYIDDIQHTHPEFLQKFISLCDGTRRIEGVWRGRSRSYDLRGKKFCIAMAGNPYTESGELFKIPDMLANRADVYNLGDVLGDHEAAFKRSYLENALTANPVLAPLATRGRSDLDHFLDQAEGRTPSPATPLQHDYSAAERGEIIATLRHLVTAREVLFAVNRQYIASAAQADVFRSEPPFRLQGSYRNMAKLAARITAAMNADELQREIDDHYAGEAQLLTSGAEENRLKLAELRGRLDADGTARWAEIKREYRRQQAIGGADADVGSRVVAQLVDLVGGVRALAPAAESTPPWSTLTELLQRLSERRTPNAAAEFSTALDTGLRPLVAALLHSAEQGALFQQQLRALSAQVQALAALREAGR